MQNVCLHFSILKAHKGVNLWRTSSISSCLWQRREGAFLDEYEATYLRFSNEFQPDLTGVSVWV